MVDRHGAPSRPPPNGISKPASRGAIATATATASASASVSASVRRNLFQSQLTRRPTGGAGSTSSTATSTTSAETLRLDADLQLQLQQQQPSTAATTTGAGPDLASTGVSSSSASSAAAVFLDIVIRDQNGEIELGDPPTPVEEELDEVVLDARQEGEKERQRLAEAVKQHQIDQNSVPAQPEELLEAVRASLRAKVAALAEDNWMYEREELPRHH